MAIPFKIFKSDEWDRFQQDGVFNGSADDRRDGFIHLSYPDQLLGTLNRYFTACDGVILAAVYPGDPAALKDEISRGGALFPHYFKALQIDDMGASVRVERSEDGYRPEIVSAAVQQALGSGGAGT